MRTKGAHFSGSASSGKIASTGHSGSQAPQSMHSSGSMMSIRSNSWMQSTGQTSTHERSLMSMQGSAMMYVILASSLARLPDQAFDQIADPLHERGLRHHLVEAGFVRGAEPTGVGVVRKAEDGNVGVCVCDLVWVDARDVRDHEVRRV